MRTRKEIESEYQDRITQEDENESLREENDNLQEMIDEIKGIIN